MLSGHYYNTSVGWGCIEDLRRFKNISAMTWKQETPAPISVIVVSNPAPMAPKATHRPVLITIHGY